MKDAIGGSLLLNIVVIFTSIIILFFVTMLAYTKAYKIKNRIIEVIEKNEKYDGIVTRTQLNDDLRRAGYITATKDEIDKKCNEKNLNSLAPGETGYLYCVYCKDYNEATGTCAQETTYEVVTYIHFNLPIIGNMMTFAVKGETKTLGRVYDY